jgi:hypothetical protein
VEGRARAGVLTEVLMSVEPSIGGRRRARRRRATPAAELERAGAEWCANCAHVQSDNELFDALIATTVRDLRALITPAPGGRIVSAGIPWVWCWAPTACSAAPGSSAAYTHWRRRPAGIRGAPSLSSAPRPER